MTKNNKLNHYKH